MFLQSVIECLPQELYLCFCCRLFTFSELWEKAGSHKGGNEGENHHDDKHFHQGETLPVGLPMIQLPDHHFDTPIPGKLFFRYSKQDAAVKRKYSIFT